MSDVERLAQVVPASERAMREWESQVAQADEVIGHSLIGGKDNEDTLDSLIGVPFLIETVTFRRGDVSIAPKGEPAVYRDYMSVEALIHPQYQARFKRSRVVFNDGSTGIYRQVVKYLAAREILTVPDDRPEEGGSNESRYDVSFSEWRTGPDGEGSWSSPTVGIRLFCPEGLRKSEYANEYGEAATWYLA